MNKLIRNLSTRCVCTFLISFFISCQVPQNQPALSILWKENKAIGLIIPAKLVNYQNGDNISVRLAREPTPILGEIKTEGDHFLFTPLVPLTRGLLYNVSAGPELIGEIEIPLSEAAAPVLLAVYPTQDTVPENLLKIYLRFSQPMSEGRSLSYVKLLKNDRDTMKGTFLDLQPELWNTSGTVLTLWLDPGRIKRDLIPNRELGTPLHNGDAYTLHILAGWKSKDGLAMEAPISKAFVTKIRDEKSPEPDRWIVVAPRAGTTDPLEINFLESLDYSLCSEAIQIRNGDKEQVPGNIQLGEEERTFRFVPNNAWKAGSYTINIESRLEDLAGNNLNRPFDRDLNVKGNGNDEKITFSLKFVVQ